MDEGVNLITRLVGAAEVAAGVRQVAGAVEKTGTAAKHAKHEAGALGTVTTGLLRPFRYLKEEALGVAKGMAAAGLAFGSVEGIKKSIETTDNLVKTTVRLHEQFGLSTESASGLAGVLQARGLDAAGLQMGFIALSRQMAQAAHGSASAAGAFRHFGMDTHDVRKALHGKDGLSGTFETIVDRLTEMHGGATKAALGQQLLGRASRGLAPLMQEGALGLRQQLKWAKEYGVTLDEHTVGSVEGMAAAQTQAQYAMLGLQIQIGRFAAPLVTKANIALADIVKSFKTGHETGGHFARTVFEIGTDLKPLGHDLAVVGGYLKDHPKLLRDAALAYGAYRLGLLKLLTMAPKAYGAGLITGRAYGAGFQVGAGEAGLPGLGGAGAKGGLLRLLTGTAGRALLGVGIAHEIARHVLHSHNADPLDILNPENAGLTPGSERHHLRAMRGRGMATSQLAAYYGRHPQLLDRETLDALGRHTAYGPDQGGGHFHIYIDGKEVAHVMADRHGKVIASGVAKAAQDAAARKHR